MYHCHGITSHMSFQTHKFYNTYTEMRLRTQTAICLLQDVKNRRNPRLVPYILLDERTKKSNKDSLKEAVRTLLGYGYNLEAPDHDHGIVLPSYPLIYCPFQKVIRLLITYPISPIFLAYQSGLSRMSVEQFRIFRAEKTYSVNVGKWYFELMVRNWNALVSEF